MWRMLLTALALLVCTSGVRADQSPQGDDHSHDDTLASLIQEAEVHHAVYTRSVQKLHKHLSTRDYDGPALLRTKRDSSGRVEASLVAFCQVLMNGPGSNLSSSSPPPTAMPTDVPDNKETSSKWHTPESQIAPLSVSVTKVGDESVVEMRVRHNISGFVYPLTTFLFDLGDVKRRQKLKIRKKDKVPKISTVRFTFKTPWCSDETDRNRAVGFSFDTKLDRNVSTYLHVHLCDERDRRDPPPPEGSNESGEDRANAIPLFPPRALFRYNLTHESLQAKKGKNVTLLAEIELPTAPSFKLNFIVSTWSYNHTSGVVSQSTTFVDVQKAHDEDNGSGEETFLMFQANNNFGLPLALPVSKFTTLEGFRANATSEAEKRTAYLRMTFHTAQGDQSGLVVLEQGMKDAQEKDVEGAGISLSLPVTLPGQDDPMPDSVVKFWVLAPRIGCNTNPEGLSLSGGDSDCVVRCQVFGRQVERVELVKEGGKLPGKPNYLNIGKWVNTAALWLKPTDPQSAGTYHCKARTRSGQEFTKSTEVVVGRFPEIIRGMTFAEDDFNGTVTFACFATGRDLQLSLRRMDYSQGFAPVSIRVDEDPAYGKVWRRTTNSRSFTLTMPTDEARRFTHVCNATNDLAYDVKFFHNFSGPE